MSVAQSREQAQQIVDALNAAPPPTEQPRSFVCGQHGTHPHGGRVCSHCSACLATVPNASTATHDLGRFIRIPREVTEVTSPDMTSVVWADIETARDRAELTEAVRQALIRAMDLDPETPVHECWAQALRAMEAGDGDAAGEG